MKYNFPYKYVWNSKYNDFPFLEILIKILEEYTLDYSSKNSIVPYKKLYF